MINKIFSTDLYTIKDNDYYNFEEYYTYWDNKKKKFFTIAPEFILVKNGKELYTGINVHTIGTSTNDLLVWEKNMKKASYKDILYYLTFLSSGIRITNFTGKLKNFINNQSYQRKRNN